MASQRLQFSNDSSYFDPYTTPYGLNLEPVLESTQNYVSGSTDNHIGAAGNFLGTWGISTALTRTSMYGSYVYNFVLGEIMPLPVIPESYTESLSVSWSATAIPGRGSSYQTYGNTNNRSVSISFKIHTDLLDYLDKENETRLGRLDRFFESLCYAYYSPESGAIYPPTCYIQIAGQTGLRGIITSYSIDHQLPIKYRSANSRNEYSFHTITLQFLNTPLVSPSMSSIRTSGAH